MSLAGEQVLLRVYLQSADRAPLIPSHERIVKAARKEKLAGATVLRGILGTGYHGIIRQSSWSIVEHVPVIVEIVDSAEKIAAFVQGPLNDLLITGFATLERAAVMLYRDRSHDQPAGLRLAAPQKPLSTIPKIQPGTHMTIQENGVLLRVFIGDSDRFEHKPLHQAIVARVRELGLAGATVLRGTAGFGAHSAIHKSSVLDLSADLPLVIEIVDSEEKIKILLPELDKMVREGMITMEYVSVIAYRHGDDQPT